jgi:hypothetical protein
MATRGKALIFFGLGCSSALAGCGARTATLFDDEGSLGGYGEETGIGGGQSVSGGIGYGGSISYGGSFSYAGSISYGGYYTAGSPGIGGSISTAGTSFGGSGHGGSFTAGSSGISGSGPTAGSGFGGFGAVAGFGEAGTGGTGVIVQGCVAAAQSACNRCQCETCASELNACFGDPSFGCAQILICAQLTQCQGFGCYQSSTCRDVIDKYGGLTGSSVAQVFAIASCALSSSASCGCN